MKALVLLGILPFLWQFKGNVFLFQKDILLNALNTQEYGMLSGRYTSPSEINNGIYKLINFHSPRNRQKIVNVLMISWVKEVN